MDALKPVPLHTASGVVEIWTCTCVCMLVCVCVCVCVCSMGMEGGGRENSKEIKEYRLIKRYCSGFLPSNSHLSQLKSLLGLPGGPVVKNLPTSAANTSLIPGSARSYMPQGN